MLISLSENSKPFKDITRNNATTMPANMLPTPHHQITPNQTPNIDRDHRHRPHNPPPQVCHRSHYGLFYTVQFI